MKRFFLILAAVAVFVMVGFSSNSSSNNILSGTYIGEKGVKINFSGNRFTQTEYDGTGKFNEGTYRLVVKHSDANSSWGEIIINSQQNNGTYKYRLERNKLTIVDFQSEVYLKQGSSFGSNAERQGRIAAKEMCDCLRRSTNLTRTDIERCFEAINNKYGAWTNDDEFRIAYIIEAFKLCPKLIKR